MQRTLHNRRAFALSLVALFLGHINARSGAEVTFAEALDSPGLTWAHSGTGQWCARNTTDAHDGVDCVEILDAYDDAGNYITATLSTQITGPAVVRFWWRHIAIVTDIDVRVGLDDGFLNLNSLGWYAAPDGWTQVELQLSAGPHTLAFRPYQGTSAQVDQVTVTPGTGGLIQAAGDPSLSWVIPNAVPWLVSTDAPPGLTHSAAVPPADAPYSVACLVPQNSKVEGWFKLTTPGRFQTALDSWSNYRLYRDPAPDWQRLRVITSSRWFAFAADSYGSGGDPVPPDLKLAGITVSPAGPGDILDAPELSWTASGSPPFVLTEDDAGSRASGSLWAENYPDNPGPFTTSVSTTLTGPGRLIFSGMGYGSPGNMWRVTVDGTVTEFLHQTSRTWRRHSVDVPPGTVAAEIAGVSVSEYGYFVLDDVTMVTAADAAQKDALDIPAGGYLWIRQSAAALWTRTTTVTHDGMDALALAPSSSSPRRADLILPVAGPLAGVWIKSRPDTVIGVTVSGKDVLHDGKLIKPATAPDWSWTPLYTGPNSTELRLTVPVASDTGEEVYLDGFTSYQTAVPAAVALDTPGRTWSGAPGLVLPGSDAVGENAVLLDGSDPGTAAVFTTVAAPFRLKFRHRFCGPFSSNVGRIVYSDITPVEFQTDWHSPGPPSPWVDRDLTFFEDRAAVSTLSFECGYGAMLLDDVEIIPMHEVTLAEALDAPGLSAVADPGWKGRTEIGHDAGGDALASPVLYNPYAPPVHRNYDLQISLPAAGSAVDGGFWWKNEPATILTFRPYGSSTAGDINYANTGWQRVRLHYDRAPSQLGWTESAYWGPWAPPNIRPGSALLDDLSLVPAAPDSFSNALDTNIPGATIGISGWDALGDAVARVQNTVTWQDGDALEIRATPGGYPVQSTLISSKFTSGTDFSCRVKRGANAGATLSLLIEGRQTIEAQDFAEIPLTEEWTEFRVLLPAAYRSAEHQISFRVTVPDAGPDAVVYLDAVSLHQYTDVNAALETTGLTWTGGGAGVQIIGGEFLFWSVIPPYEGYFDGVSFQGLNPGEQAWLETTLTGPGTAVLTGYRGVDSWGGWSTQLLVDGILKDALAVNANGPFHLQAVVPPGNYTVRWLASQSEEGPAQASLRLHSFAFVPGAPAEALPNALQTLAPGRTWQPGGSHPPVPLYRLVEGVTELSGISFPALAAGETSSLETVVTGTAQVRFTWECATPATAVCRVDGRTATRAMEEPVYYYTLDPLTQMEIPAGPHTIRWEGGTSTSQLSLFATTPGSKIVAILAGPGPPFIWVRQPAFTYGVPWRVVTDGTLSGRDQSGNWVEVPGTGRQVLGGGDSVSGFFWLTGPAVVTWDLRKSSQTFTPAWLDWNLYYYANRPLDFQWHQEALVVPPGEHAVSFDTTEDDSGYEPYAWLKDIRIIPGAAYPAWAAARSFDGPYDSSPAADPDNDGQVNLLEYAFGTNPLVIDSPAAPVLSGTLPIRELRFPSLPYDATGLLYEVQTSADLQTWTAIQIVSPNPPHQPGPVVPLPVPQSDREYVRVTVSL